MPLKCLAKLHQDQEDQTKAISYYRYQRNVKKINQAAFAKLLQQVQVWIKYDMSRHQYMLGLTWRVSSFGVSVQAVKQDLSEVFGVYLSFATELEDQSKQLLEKLEKASYLHGCYGDEVQSKCQ